MFRVLLIAVLSLATASIAAGDTLRAAAAISLKDALLAIEPEYEAATGDTLEFSFGASGQLAMQIKSGAPIDLFISAAREQVDDLLATGHATRNSVRIVAQNRLVLIVPAASKDAPRSFQALADAKGARIAIGEPASVPAGTYARQVFQTLGLSDRLNDKLVFGANVRQVLAYVERGEVAAGVVYSTDALQSGDKVRVVATADAGWHQPIVYPAVLIQGSKSAAAARRFLDYLQTPAAFKALTSRGFTVSSPSATQPAE